MHKRNANEGRWRVEGAGQISSPFASKAEALQYARRQAKRTGLGVLVVPRRS